MEWKKFSLELPETIKTYSELTDYFQRVESKKYVFTSNCQEALEKQSNILKRKIESGFKYRDVKIAEDSNKVTVYTWIDEEDVEQLGKFIDNLKSSYDKFRDELYLQDQTKQSRDTLRQAQERV